MNDKFVLEIDKNDSLVEFVRYILSSRSSSVPKLSLPILDKNYELPRFLGPEKLISERHENENKKIKIFNKCFRILPLYPENCNKRFIFGYSNRQPEKCSYSNLLADKKRNLNNPNKKIDLSCNYSSGLLSKGITPLRERVCMACRKNSLSRPNIHKDKNQKKNHNSLLNYPKVFQQNNRISATDGLFQQLFNTNSRVFSMFEEDSKVIESFQTVGNNLKIDNYIPKNFIDNTIKSQKKKTIQEMSFSFNDFKTKDELHSQYLKKKLSQLLNTDSINLKNNKLDTIFSVERLSI